MKRVLIAFLLAPFLVSLMFGIFALVAFPFMLIVTLFIALPLFLTLKRVGWLQWWHAVLAGMFCSVGYITADTLLNYMSYTPNLDRLVNANNIFYIGLGAVTGFTFWWVGIFRNPAFPEITTRFPRSVLLVLPLFAGAYLVHHALLSSQLQGRVLSIKEAPVSTSKVGQAIVRLSSGSIVQADVSNTWPRSMVEGQCFYLERRFSTFRVHRIYELISPFGGGVNDC